jgi:multidrug resistance efflux pump
MNAVVRLFLTLIVVSAASFLGYEMARYYLYSPWTRDARIRADVVTVAPDVSGYVTRVRVHNNQFVKRGDILFDIEQERYRLALANAAASLAAQYAQRQMLLDQYQRRSKLTLGLTITAEGLESARRQFESAAASHEQATAARDVAALNLERTEVRAPVNGFVTNLNLAPGVYATQGKGVLALIDSDSYRVEAYFEETKIPHIKPGSPVEIHLLDGAGVLQGQVEGVARGITDQDNKDGPELLASVNPNFTWVRLAQRIPVRVRLTDVPPGVLISAGMTCTVIVKDGASPQIGARIRRLVSAVLEPLEKTAIAR